MGRRQRMADGRVRQGRREVNLNAIPTDTALVRHCTKWPDGTPYRTLWRRAAGRRGRCEPRWRAKGWAAIRRAHASIRRETAAGVLRTCCAALAIGRASARSARLEQKGRMASDFLQQVIDRIYE